MKRLSIISGCIAVMLLLASTTVLSAKTPPKPDMSINLEDGREVVLKPDSTWQFAEFSFIQEDMDDIYMDLTDGRILCLKNDNTWKFVRRRPPKKKLDFKDLPTVNAKTTATNGSLDAAVKQARKKVFDRAASRLLRYAKKSKMTNKYLVACIIDEVGEEGAEVSYVKGWTATAQLTLSKVQVGKILDCVQVQVEAGTGTAKDTSAKADAATSK